MYLRLRRSGRQMLLDATWLPHKPVVVDLHNTGLTGKHDKCYMAATGACDTKISGEHLISHSVLKIFAEKQVELSGLPWQKPGDKKMLGFSTLITNALCRRHNSLLSPIELLARGYSRRSRSAGRPIPGLACCFCYPATT